MTCILLTRDPAPWGHCLAREACYKHKYPFAPSRIIPSDPIRLQITVNDLCVSFRGHHLFLLFSVCPLTFGFISCGCILNAIYYYSGLIPQNQYRRALLHSAVYDCSNISATS